ncbi:MAG: CCA tRNA nucleotidyltransferase [Planctomycetota bacterium]
MSYASAVAIVERLRGAGHVAVLAGGCVRDRLLGLEPKDYDVATSAEPAAVLEMFRGARAVGEAFGVVLVPHRHRQIEVATFREEWGYSDGRRPDGVRFTDAAHDAQRRDFTINALFADPAGELESLKAGKLEISDGVLTREVAGFGVVIDFVGGLADLDARVLRAVGDASRRFEEDYLRMLRAVRFSARLGFELEATTGRAVRASARYLGQISRERIGAELGMMLGHPTRAAAAELLAELKLDGPVLNEDAREVAVDRLAALGPGAGATVGLAAWLLDRHLPGAGLVDAGAWDFRPVLRRVRRAVCLSNADDQAVAGALAGLGPIAGWAGLRLCEKKRALGRPHARLALELAATLGDVSAVAGEAERLWAQGVSPEPWVTGEDLIALGRSPGPAFGPLLDAVYDAQLGGEAADREAALRLLAELAAADGAGRAG